MSDILKKEKRKKMLFGIYMTAFVLAAAFTVYSLARYVSDEIGADNARAALWNVNIETGGDLLNNEYDYVDGALVATTSSEQIMLYPGASGKGTVAIAGSAETDVSITYTLHMELENWTAEDSFYCPIEFSVGDATIKGTSYTDAQDFIDAVSAEISAYDNTVEANSDLGNTEAPQITWKWEDDTDSTKDTFLAANANEGNDPAMMFVLEITVKQID